MPTVRQVEEGVGQRDRRHLLCCPSHGTGPQDPRVSVNEQWGLWAQVSSSLVSRGGHYSPLCNRNLTRTRTQCCQVFPFYVKSLNFYVVASIFSKVSKLLKCVCRQVLHTNLKPLFLHFQMLPIVPPQTGR